MSIPKAPSLDRTDDTPAPQETLEPRSLPPAEPEEDDDGRFADQPCTD